MSATPAAPAFTAATAATAAPATPAPPSRYLVVLGTAFALFGTLRLVSYLPTLLAIVASGDSQQHSLWTWGIWLGSNLTMALWLREQHGGRWTSAAVLSGVNAAMCAATVTVILAFRL